VAVQLSQLASGIWYAKLGTDRRGNFGELYVLIRPFFSGNLTLEGADDCVKCLGVIYLY
jgi:hypothetical protein